MTNSYTKIIINSLFTAIIGVWVIDYFSHLLFSDPMETMPYFTAKTILYFVFSILFLSVPHLNENEFIKVAGGGVVVSSLWGMYYNIFPSLFHYYPFGLPLAGLTFLGTGVWGTGIAFGIVHILAFIGGYYASRFAVKNMV